MPSAEETYLIEVMPDESQDFLSRDVDLLVSQLKENLRLSSLKAKSSISQKNRASPYRIPSRSWADPGGYDLVRNQEPRHVGHQKRTSAREDDPYELLQELLREGGLIKEAVKRLQANLDQLENSEEEEEEEEEEEHSIYRRKRQNSVSKIFREAPAQILGNRPASGNSKRKLTTRLFPL